MEPRSKMKQKPEGNKTWYNPEGKNLARELSNIDTQKKKIDYIMRGEK